MMKGLSSACERPLACYLAICEYRLCLHLLRVSFWDSTRAGVTSEDEFEASSSFELGMELTFVVTTGAVLKPVCLMPESMRFDVVWKGATAVGAIWELSSSKLWQGDMEYVSVYLDCGTANAGEEMS